MAGDRVSHKQGYRVELAPEAEQVVAMGRHCGLSRVVENFCLEVVQKRWAQRKAEESYGLAAESSNSSTPCQHRDGQLACG